MTRFRILATIIFLAAGLALGLPFFAEAQLPPALYRCTVYEDGVLAGANHNVTAYVGSEMSPRVWELTSSYGVAILMVPVTGAEVNSTEPISFKVDGTLATETPDVSVTMGAPEVRLDLGTSVAIECASVPEGGSVETDITIATDEPEGIGSATITLTVDTAVVSVGSVTAGDLGTVISNTVGGTTTMTAATGASPGPTGTVTFATVTLNAVGSSGECSDLDIEVTSLNDGTAGDPQAVTPDRVTDCTVCIGVPTTPTPAPGGGGGMSGGAIAGIVIGSLIALGLVLWLVIRRRG